MMSLPRPIQQVGLVARFSEGCICRNRLCQFLHVTGNSIMESISRYLHYQKIINSLRTYTHVGPIIYTFWFAQRCVAAQIVTPAQIVAGDNLCNLSQHYFNGVLSLYDLHVSKRDVKHLFHSLTPNVGTYW